MAHTRAELVAMLSDIEPTPETYAGLTADDAPALRELTSHQEAWLAARAVHGLARLRDQTALAGITAAADDPRSAVRIAVATVSATLPTATAAPLLTRLLGDGDVGVVKYAVRSTRPSLGDPVRDALRDVVRRPLPEVVQDAARRRLEQMPG